NVSSRAWTPKPSVMTWLLDADPSIRWQVMRDLGDERDDVVTAERSRVGSEGWGAQLLDRQRPDGKWGDGIADPQWASTLHTLLLLRQLGIDPRSERARKAVSLIRDKVTWGSEFGDSPFFEGEVEPCINGGALALGAYFGEASARLVDRLLGEQLEDGGWNCEAERGSVRSSFHTTICVLEGLLECEKANGAAPAVTAARVRAPEDLLDRRMFRRLSTGEVIDRNWTRFSFPTTWHYDVLRGLDYFRSAGVEDERMAEAVGLVTKRRHQNGRWPRNTPHPDPVHLDMEGGRGTPSRWNTLRASRVLRWYSARDDDAGERPARPLADRHLRGLHAAQPVAAHEAQEASAVAAKRPHSRCLHRDVALDVILRRVLERIGPDRHPVAPGAEQRRHAPIVERRDQIEPRRQHRGLLRRVGSQRRLELRERWRMLRARERRQRVGDQLGRAQRQQHAGREHRVDEAEGIADHSPAR